MLRSSQDSVKLKEYVDFKFEKQAEQEVAQIEI
jgi:hypothetical protein